MEVQTEIIKALAYGIIFILFITCGIILFFYYSRKKIIQKEIEKISILLNKKQEVLQASINAQEEERRRIAQDLHDAISAKLNVINLTAHMLLNKTKSLEQRESLEHIININSKTLESSRKIAHELLPPVLEKFGLSVALEELFDDFTKSKNLEINYSIDNLPNLKSLDDLHLFRIVQELINNSIRHGESTLINVKLISTENGFELIFKDNGKGFDVFKQSKRSGLGLQNIESRVAILNCNFTIDSKINHGSTFIVKSKTDE